VGLMRRAEGILRQAPLRFGEMALSVPEVEFVGVEGGHRRVVADVQVEEAIAVDVRQGRSEGSPCGIDNDAAAVGDVLHHEPTEVSEHPVLAHATGQEEVLVAVIVHVRPDHAAHRTVTGFHAEFHGLCSEAGIVLQIQVDAVQVIAEGEVLGTITVHIHRTDAGGVVTIQHETGQGDAVADVHPLPMRSRCGQQDAESQSDVLGQGHIYKIKYARMRRKKGWSGCPCRFVSGTGELCPGMKGWNEKAPKNSGSPGLS